MNLDVLPLAITMMAGPAIMAAVVFVTHPRAVPVSAAFVVGVAAATTLGVALAAGLAHHNGENVSLGDDDGWAGKAIELALVVALVAMAVKTYVRRESVEPPRWLGSLLKANAGKALAVGLIVILLGPSDIVVLLTVGAELERSGSTLGEAAPFIILTAAIAGLPLTAYVLFRRRAVRATPRVREWMNSHAWVINIAVCVIFILLII
jgi:hypothetical protein